MGFSLINHTLLGAPMASWKPRRTVERPPYTMARPWRKDPRRGTGWPAENWKAKKQVILFGQMLVNIHIFHGACKGNKGNPCKPTPDLVGGLVAINFIFPLILGF